MVAAAKRLPIVIVALLGLAACRDDASNSSSSQIGITDPSRVEMYCFEPTPDCPAPPPNPSDTRVSADVTYRTSYVATLSENFTDPVTGSYTNVLQVEPPDVRVHVEAGYAANGQTRVTTSWSDGADATTAVMPQITSQDLAGDYLTDINPYGYSLVTSTPGAMSAAPAMDLVGSTANGDITAGLLVDLADTIVFSQSVSTAGTPQLSANRTPLSASSVGAGASDTSAARAFARASKGEKIRSRLHGIDIDVRASPDGAIVVEDVATGSTVGSLSAGAVSPTKGDRHTRKFRKHGSGWILEEDRAEFDADDERGRRRMANVTTYSNVKVHKNAKRDAERHALRPTTDWIPRVGGTPAQPSTFTTSSAMNSRGAMLVPRGPNRIEVCGDVCAGGGYVPPAPPPFGVEPPCDPSTVANVGSSPANLNILYQHGFASSARTWCTMSKLVRERFEVSREIRHSLSWPSSYEDQAAQLQSLFRNDASAYPGPYVLIGHSNGGIVNRYMAQQIQDPSLVYGVVTISSPHAGVYLANTSERILVGALSIPFTGAAMGCDIANAYICTQGRNLAGQVAAALAPVLASGLYPVLQEMRTNSPFHGTINARGDAAYRVAGVQNRVWDRWSAWRLLADYQQCAEGYILCDEFSRNYVTSVDKNYHHFIKCAVVSGIFGIVFPGSRRAAVACAKNAAWLRGADFAYKRLSVGSYHGDAVVPEFSQMYPGAPPVLQFLVDDSNSHVGETRSRLTANGVLRALNRGIGFPFDR